MVLDLSHKGDWIGKFGTFQDEIVDGLAFVMLDIPSDAMASIPLDMMVDITLDAVGYRGM